MLEKKKPSGNVYRERRAQLAAENEKQAAALKKFFHTPETVNNGNENKEPENEEPSKRSTNIPEDNNTVQEEEEQLKSETIDIRYEDGSAFPQEIVIEQWAVTVSIECRSPCHDPKCCLDAEVGCSSRVYHCRSFSGDTWAMQLGAAEGRRAGEDLAVHCCQLPLTFQCFFS